MRMRKSAAAIRAVIEFGQNINEISNIHIVSK
jgi:hypothetical protein